MSTSELVYIHYGSPKFDINKFHPISNIEFSNKPHGGLWTSPVNSDYNWKWWCLSNHYKTDRLNEHFSFKLKDNANICRISSRQDLVDLKEQGFCHDYADSFLHPQDYYPDFEKLVNSGYDGMAVMMNNNLYYSLYGWDCDSLLVFDPDCMIFV